MFKSLRITVLLIILVLAAAHTWLSKARSTDWNNTLWVVIYPINQNGSQPVGEYIKHLNTEDFVAIDKFFSREAKRYGLSLQQPISIKLAPEVKSLPPPPPNPPTALSTIGWSLKMRYWAYVEDTYKGPSADIQVFVVYHDPNETEQVAHSLGLEKGLIALVNAYSGKRQEPGNNVIIAHELLHTVGATDKYELSTNLPIYPQGYAYPEARPLYPQTKAEVMGGRIPLSKLRAVIPHSLNKVVIGDATAKEIHWSQD